MAGLPFLVVHGALIAKLLVGLVIIAGFGGVLVLRERKERQRARQQVRELARRVVAPHEGDVVVRGVYRGTWIDVAGEKIALGHPAIVYGSRARLVWRGVEHRLVEGDEVIATGALAHVPPEGEASYREAKPSWTLSAARLYATPPAVHAPPLAPRSALLLLLGCAGAAWIGLQLVGQACLQPWKHQDRGLHSLGFNRIVLAAALPGTREEALARLDDIVDIELARTPETIAMRVGIARLREGCRGEVEMLTDQVQLEAAVAAATACDEPAYAANALALLGRFDEALAEPRDLDLREKGIAAIEAGKWGIAAEAAHETSAMLDRNDYRVWARGSAQGFACLAMWFRALDGDQRSADALAADEHPECKIVAAMAKPHDIRASALLAARDELPPDLTFRLRDTAGVLAWADGRGEPDSRAVVEAAYEVPERASPAALWLAPFAVAATSTSQSCAWMAVHESVRGNVETALENAASSSWEHLETTIWLRAGYLKPLEPIVPSADAALLGEREPDRVLVQALQLHDGKLPEHIENAFCELDPAFHAALSGQGAPLAKLLEDCAWTPPPEITMLGVLPHVTEDRDALARALRTPRFEVHDALPFRFIQHAALRRDLARLAGDTEDAARWQAIVDRHLKALDNHDRVAALLLWLAM